MKLGPEDLRRLLRLLDRTADEEIDCTEFLHRMPGYFERLVRERTVPPGYADVIRHLEICPECREEFAAMDAARRDRT